MWKVSYSPAPSSLLFMPLPFVDILHVVGVNWKRRSWTCTLTCLERGCGSKLKMAEKLEDQERKSGNDLKYHENSVPLAELLVKMGYSR